MKPIEFSVIIEWENVKLSKLTRASRMLEALTEQVRQLDCSRFLPVDLVVLYDSQAVDLEFLRRLIHKAMGDQMLFQNIRLTPADGRRYYEIKNYGATLTDAEVIVFLDSDVIPEPDWLQQLLEALETECVQVVGGNTYIEPASLYSKAFALFWFFPLRSESGGLFRSKNFYANNVAFNKSLFEAHLFPAHKKFRGQCDDLARQLTELDVNIFIQKSARVSHPPPNGPFHFTARALCAGHDHVANAPGKSILHLVRMAGRNFFKSFGLANQKIGRNGAQLGLGIPGRIAARGIALAYYSIVFLGACITIVAPTFVPKYFPV